MKKPISRRSNVRPSVYTLLFVVQALYMHMYSRTHCKRTLCNLAASLRSHSPLSLSQHLHVLCDLRARASCDPRVRMWRPARRPRAASRLDLEPLRERRAPLARRREPRVAKELRRRRARRAVRLHAIVDDLRRGEGVGARR